MAGKKRKNGNGNGNGQKIVVVQAAPSRANSGKAARRRRARARRRLARAGVNVIRDGMQTRPLHPGGGLGPGALTLINQAPVALANRLANKTPRFQSIEGGVIVAHSQKIFDFDSQGTSQSQRYRFNMNPRSLGWIAEIAEHFQHFVIREMTYRYVGTCSTGAGARVTMAPWYEPQVPSALQSPNGFAEFVRDLPGVQEFAAWASSALGVAVEQFSRQVFRTVGLLGYEPLAMTNAAGDDIESINPGQLLVNIFSGAVADDAPIGELWCDYVVELRGAKSRTTPTVQFNSSSTDDADLGLHTGSYLGDAFVAKPLTTNSITFNRKGRFTIVIRRTGTSPVEAVGSYTITDAQNNAQVDARMVDTLVSSVFTDANSVDDHAWNVASATASLLVFSVYAEIGDRLTIPALTSGSVTLTRILVMAAAPDLVWVS